MTVTVAEVTGTGEHTAPLGRMARGFVLGIQDDERFRESIRAGRERGETLKETFGDAFGAAWRGAAEEWRTAEDEREEEKRTSRDRSGEWRERATRATNFIRGNIRWRCWERTTGSASTPEYRPKKSTKNGAT